MKKPSVFILGLIILVIVVMGWFTYQSLQNQSQQRVIESSAGSALVSAEGESLFTDIAGNPVTLDDYLGSVLVVNSWASWSPFSAQELPRLSELSQQYSTDEVVVLAINRAEPATTAQSFLQSLNISEDVQLLLDPADAYYKRIEGYSMPETVFYNTQGDIVFHKHGLLTLEEMNQYVSQALESSQE